MPHLSEKMSYSVDIDTANAVKKEIAATIDTSSQQGNVVLNKVGAFASLLDIDLRAYRDPVLVMKTEEPGSKQKLALEYDRAESISFDMINHLTNDVIVMGAKPVAVQDAIICGEIEPEIVSRLVKGMNQACREQDCFLVGGETSEQPGVLQPGQYILTSCMVGVVERDRCVDGATIAAGDTILALPSNGPHTNGYTLIRKLLDTYPDLKDQQVDGESFIDVVLRPHTSYYPVIKKLLNKVSIQGMAHITGGGMKENIDRILPLHIDAAINLNQVQVPAVFKLIQEKSGIEDEALLRTFNCGVGMVVVVRPDIADEVVSICKASGVVAYPIGKIVPGAKKVQFEGKLTR